MAQQEKDDGDMMTTKRTYRGVSLALLVTMTSLAIPSTSFAADDEGAEAAFKRGFELFEEGNYQAALVEFKQAYKMSPNYKMLYNIGLVSKQLNDYAGALDAFTRYLADGGTNIVVSRRVEVNQEIQKLRNRVAQVSIKVDKPGAEISVDGASVGVSPLPAPLTLNIGRVRVTARLNDRTDEKVIELIPGQSMAIDLKVSAATVTLGQGDKHVEEDKGPKFPWAPWAITALVGGGAAVTGVLALGAKSDYDKKEGIYGVSKSDLDSASSKASTFGLVTDILLGCTVIGAGVSTYFTVKWMKDKKQFEKEKSDQKGPAQAGVQLGVSPFGAVMSGTF